LGVQYIYTETEQKNTAVKKIVLITDNFQVMPQSWLLQLLNAVLEVDSEEDCDS
jgi:hypothetical protein